MATWRATSDHAGMGSPTSLAAARIERFLVEEPIVWLSTVRPDGGPHIVPIWFWWDGAAILVFSKPDAQKVRNLRARSSVMLALGDAEDDFDVGMIRGAAELLDQRTSEVMPAAHLDKYRDRMTAIGLDADSYAATYSQVIRIVPQDYLGWHGRTVPRSARLAGAPTATIREPVPAAAAASHGEPIAHRPEPRAERQPVTRRRGRWANDLGRLGEPLTRGLRGIGVRPLVRGAGSA
jgi:PPOX class probable F420-dependent enzyme